MPELNTNSRITLDGNRNFLLANRYRLYLDMFPGTDFMCQDVSGPGGVVMPVTSIDTIYRTIPNVPGGGLQLSDLAITFLVSEDLRNYYSIHKWLMINGNSGQTTNCNNNSSQEIVHDESSYNSNSVYSSITEQISVTGRDELGNAKLIILDSSHRNTFLIEFGLIFPYSLTGLRFSAKSNDADIMVATCLFKYNTIKFKTYINPYDPNMRLETAINIKEDDGYNREANVTTQYENDRPKIFDKVTVGKNKISQKGIEKNNPFSNLADKEKNKRNTQISTKKSKFTCQ